MKNYKTIGDPMCVPAATSCIGAVTLDVKYAYYEPEEGAFNMQGAMTEIFDANGWETSMISLLVKLMMTEFGADEDVLIESLDIVKNNLNNKTV